MSALLNTPSHLLHDLEYFGCTNLLKDIKHTNRMTSTLKLLNEIKAKCTIIPDEGNEPNFIAS